MSGLEAVLICADNSEWMRNGDYAPTRLQAQAETVNFLASAKINGHPDTVCGVLSMAGSRVTVHSSPVRSLGKIMNCVKALDCFGTSNFLGGLRTAQLALKNRQNKSQKQRIIMFVGSPILDDQKALVKLGKNLKKNNIAVDVINFGVENTSNENQEKLEAFISATNSSDNSHLVTIPPGPHIILSDLVLSSSIMGASGEAGAGAGGFGGGGNGAFGGVDPNMEPDLAMAIRMSMEEERARQQGARGGDAAAVPPATAAAAAPAAAAAAEVVFEDDEEAMLAQAIAMSMAMNQSAGAEEQDVEMAVQADATAPATTVSPPIAAASAPAAVPAATAAAAAPAAAAPAAAPVAAAPAAVQSKSEDAFDFADALADPDFISSLLDSTGVGKDELEIDDILNQIIEEDDKEANQESKKAKKS